MQNHQPVAAPHPDHQHVAFPPRRDYASLSIKDLLDARDAYRVYLSSLSNVVATAVGRYYIHENDWYAENPPTVPRPSHFPRVTEPKTLSNSKICPWSWPAVLVFVKKWESDEALGNNIVPRTLYLTDGRVVPTCVIQIAPDETPPAPILSPFQTSPVLGGGYSCLRDHQGMQSLGTISCLVTKEGSYYALTNRHVAGGDGEIVKASVRGQYQPVGTTSNIAIDRQLMSSVFPRWPGDHVYLTMDAGLIRIDNINDWTAQVFGMGEIGEIFDATEYTVTLDLIGLPVMAFGAATGHSKGQIAALFFRYASVSSYEYVTDVLVGPRPGKDANLQPPITNPGDSGALWFFDSEAYAAANEHNPDIHQAKCTTERGVNAPRYRPIAMQWGGERVLRTDGSMTSYALGTFLSTVCRSLDVELCRDWSLGYGETWGKIGHFSIGWKACDHLAGDIGTLMKKNQKSIGFSDASLTDFGNLGLGASGAFIPLADVPDYIWIGQQGLRPDEPDQHFADIDIQDIDGGPPLLDRCVADSANISATVWKDYFDGFKNAGVGPDEGMLPFRVWQIWEAMVAYLQAGDVLRFVAAGGTMGHYVGDASQPLHCSYLHHGMPPLTTLASGRSYPPRHGTDAYNEFHATREAKIHAIYEEQMLEVDPAAVLTAVDSTLATMPAITAAVTSGHEAAIQVIELMHRSQQRLTPTDIINADDPTLSQPKRAARLWEDLAIRKATVESLADSVRVLASLWTSAWTAGGGDQIPQSAIKMFDQGQLMTICRTEHGFIPSLSLDAMASSGDFEPAGAPAPVHTSPATKKAVPKKVAAKKAVIKKATPKKATAKKR